MHNGYSVRFSKVNFSWLLMAVCLSVFAGCAFIVNVQADEGFAEQYRAYQAEVNDGMASLNKKDYQGAINHYSKAIEKSPFEASHYFKRGIAFYRLEKEKEAKEDFDKVIILDPKGRSAYVYRGLCRMKGGEYKEALNDYNRALEINSRDASVHNNLAWLYATAKDEKFQDKGKALEHAKKAAELSNEKNAEILDTLARAYYINEKILEAVVTGRKALELEPNNGEFKKNLKVYEEVMTDNKK